MCVWGEGNSSELQTKSQVSAAPWGRGGRDGGCGYVVVVIGLLAKVSLRHVVFSVIQPLVKSLWHRTKVAMGLKKCCRVVSSLPTVLPSCHFAKVVLFPFF